MGSAQSREHPREYGKMNKTQEGGFTESVLAEQREAIFEATDEMARTNALGRESPPASTEKYVDLQSQ